mgnify:CR=1 FL=1
MNVLITGAAKVLGVQTSKIFANNNHHVIACDIIQPKEYINTDCFKCDITNVDQLNSLKNNLIEMGIKLDLIINFLSPILKIFDIPTEIMPLALVRPVSGSAAMAVATDIMNTYGVDSLIGKIASTIMGSTETTLYTIAIYTSCIYIKKTRGIVIAALIGDIVGMITSLVICKIIG